MEVTILNHDPVMATASIRFEHNGVKVENFYDLGMVVPTLRYVLESLGEEFTAERQQAVIDKLTAMIQRDIEDGVIKNPPAAPPAPLVEGG